MIGTELATRPWQCDDSRCSKFPDSSQQAPAIFQDYMKQKRRQLHTPSDACRKNDRDGLLSSDQTPTTCSKRCRGILGSVGPPGWRSIIACFADPGRHSRHFRERTKCLQVRFRWLLFKKGERLGLLSVDDTVLVDITMPC